jgi:hypothetical protein
MTCSCPPSQNKPKDSTLAASYANTACQCKDVAVLAQASAEASQLSAATSASQAEAALDDFQTIYLGVFASPPTTTSVGALYFNTSSNSMFAWNGISWQVISASGNVITNSPIISLSPTQGVITSVPSGVKRITFNFEDIVVAGTGTDNDIVIQFGYGVTPTYLTTGYVSGYTILGSTGASEGYVNGQGFSMYHSTVSSYRANGSITFTLFDSSINKWSSAGTYGVYNSTYVPQSSYLTYGRVDLGAGNEVSAIKIFPQSGLRTFSGGSIMATYQN